jgi:hypothetical protein
MYFTSDQRCSALAARAIKKYSSITLLFSPTVSALVSVLLSLLHNDLGISLHARYEGRIVEAPVYERLVSFRFCRYRWTDGSRLFSTTRVIRLGTRVRRVPLIWRKPIEVGGAPSNGSRFPGDEAFCGVGYLADQGKSCGVF